jgi:hypothetical protein
MPIDSRMVKWDEEPKKPTIDTRMVKWDDEKPKTTIAQDIKQGAGNTIAGLVRGAGSIGSTLIAPFDIAKDALAGKGLSLESNRQRRADMDAALGTMGADTDSFGYGWCGWRRG